jgi:hypothetical protein
MYSKNVCRSSPKAWKEPLKHYWIFSKLAWLSYSTPSSSSIMVPNFAGQTRFVRAETIFAQLSIAERIENLL